MNSDSAWKLIYNKFSPDEEGLREALCTLGNGYMGTRGAAAESFASDVHYPGTYISGLYNTLGTKIAGRTIYNEDMVNIPNWTYLSFRIGDGPWFLPSAANIIAYSQELDMKSGILSRKMRFETRKGYRTQIITQRIVHMKYPHLAAIKYVIVPENYSDHITVRTMLDGSVQNTNVERYRQLRSDHWESQELGVFAKNGIYLKMRTSRSKVELAQASKIRIFVANERRKLPIETITKTNRIAQEFCVHMQKGKRLCVEKIVSIYTSNDINVGNIKDEAVNSVKQASRFVSLLNSHRKKWEETWKKIDIRIDGDAFSQKVIRLHLFHLFQTASVHNMKIDAGLPARGLHGESYRGHIFWDALFVYPVFYLRIPQIAKALLRYRYRRLPQAKKYAAENGYKGAMFPWQSGSSGREETQIMHLNPRSGKWGPDFSRLQRHVSFAIAHSFWQYYHFTGDMDFMSKYGAEVLVSIAQFAASLVYFDKRDGRYHTKKVMGPDEFHEKLPGSSKPGLNDNAYTNVLIVWILEKAEAMFHLLSSRYKERLIEKVGLDIKEFERWDDIKKKIKIGFNKQKIIAQFEGYFKLKELDWDKYRKKYKNIQRMDRILKAEGRAPDDYKVAKQADVLMLFYVLRLDQIKEIFRNLGYGFDKKLLRRNYEYYIKRTSHGSTLSKVVHCYVSQLLGKEKEFLNWFEEVLKSDIYDTQGGTTPEGIHCGVMGGSIDIVQRGLAGLDFLDDGTIKIEPRLPRKWRRLKFRLHYRRTSVLFDIMPHSVKVSIPKHEDKGIKLMLEAKKKRYRLSAGKTVSFKP